MTTDAHLPRILIVDDEPAIQRFLKTALSNGEFTLYQAENGHAALAAAVQQNRMSSFWISDSRTWTGSR